MLRKGGGGDQSTCPVAVAQPGGNAGKRLRLAKSGNRSHSGRATEKPNKFSFDDPVERWCEMADEIIAFLKPRTQGPQDAEAVLKFLVQCMEDGEVSKACGWRKSEE